MTNSPGQPLRIALDAMGGDYGPPETVAGAVAAVTEGRGRVAVLLVGDADAVQPEVDRQGGGGLPIKVIPSEGVILDSESPLQALRAKPKASAVVGVGMVKEGIADAFVTMGSTGAAMAASALLLGMMEGLERPALGGPILGYAPTTVFMELGSSIDCRPSQLVDFAALGVAFSRTYLDVTDPRVGILSVGTEEGKGNRQSREAFPLFQASGLNFVGNLEGHDLGSDKADVVVCDGFVGNILIKTIEGLGEDLARYVTGRLASHLSEADAAAVGQDIYYLLNRIEYNGGGPLFGIKGNVIVGHGRARANGISRAVHTAVRVCETGLAGKMEEELNSLRTRTAE
ncbi:MAG: phosphate acyltransferase PlsX [Chloroflexi bacterium]|nr:phosphate acyltransferase PlsX [Chloroflexota bacterium]